MQLFQLGMKVAPTAAVAPDAAVATAHVASAATAPPIAAGPCIAGGSPLTPFPRPIGPPWRDFKVLPIGTEPEAVESEAEPKAVESEAEPKAVESEVGPPAEAPTVAMQRRPGQTICIEEVWVTQDQLFDRLQIDHGWADARCWRLLPKLETKTTEEGSVFLWFRGSEVLASPATEKTVAAHRGSLEPIDWRFRPVAEHRLKFRRVP